MSNLKIARDKLVEAYEENGLQFIAEALSIVDKYLNLSDKDLGSYTIDEMQSDSLRLTSLNFYLSSSAANFEADSLSAYNRRKFKEAANWCKYRSDCPKAKQGEIDMLAEESIEKFRADEVEVIRRFKITAAAVSSIIEIVNMLKKSVERIMWEGQSVKPT